jgi:hypothetical protein
MVVYSLYVKEHSITGLKYLGYTKTDPFTYPGSGTYWRRHLTTHGKIHTTIILLQTSKKDEIKIWGRYYSNLWDVVSAKDTMGNKLWANLRIEEGDGGGGYIFSEEDKKKIGDKSRIAWTNTESRKKRIMSIKESLNKPEVKSKISKTSKRTLADPSTKAKLKASSKKTWSDPLLREKQSLLQTEVQNREAVKEKKRAAAIDNWSNESIRRSRIEKMTDQTIYTFQNIKTGELIKSTRKELVDRFNLNRAHLSKVITGKANSIKGWKKI